MDTFTRLQSKLRDDNNQLRSLRERITALDSNLLNSIKEINNKKKKTNSSNLRANDPLNVKHNKLILEKENLKKLLADKQHLRDSSLQDLFALQTHQDAVKNLDDAYPILLLPVKIQTRFMKIKHVAKGLIQKQLFDLNHLGTTSRKKVSKRSADSLMKEVIRTSDNKPSLKLGQINTLIGKFDSKTLTDAQLGKSPLSNRKPPEQAFVMVPDKHELWVRIYPDDIAVSSHEQLLTQKEYESGVTFWLNIFEADVQFSNNTDPDNKAKQDRLTEKTGAWNALVNTWGTERAAWVVKQTRPEQATSGSDQPFLSEKPEFKEPEFKPASWSSPATSYVLPDRFIVRLTGLDDTVREVTGSPVPSDLILGIDPSTDSDSDDLELKNGERTIPEAMQWLTDFNEAEKAGMGIRISLNRNERRNGFKQVVVLGMKLSADAEQGSNLIGNLLDDHHFQQGGLALVPQGTPTNNTDTNDSGYSISNVDPRKSFRNELGERLFTQELKQDKKSDGQLLAEALGINSQFTQHLNNADKFDIAESIWMNKALYPATLGYYLKQFYSGVIPKSLRSKVRSFSENYVKGRGALPSIRTGSQPYGLLLTSSFSQWKYTGKLNQEQQFLSQLHEKVLIRFTQYWRDQLTQVKSIADKNVPATSFSEHFLQILGLHPTSTEYYQRFIGGTSLIQSLETKQQILERFMMIQGQFKEGFSVASNPYLLSHGFTEEVRGLFGPVIESLQLSETRPLRNFKNASGGDTGKNYIDWMLRASISDIRKEKFTSIGAQENQNAPRALLYLLLRHAFLQGYVKLGYTILEAGNIISEIERFDIELDGVFNDGKFRAEHEALVRGILTIERMPDIQERMSKELKIAKSREKLSIPELEQHRDKLLEGEIEELNAVTEFEVQRQKEAFSIRANKFSRFAEVYPSVTGKLTLNEHLSDLLKRKSPTAIQFTNQRNAFKKISKLPTARLERLFAEHIDTTQYRLDSWKLGLAEQRLEDMRKQQSNGIYIGAYAYIENLAPQGNPGVFVKVLKNPEQISVRKIGRTRTVIPIVRNSEFASKKDFNKFRRDAFIYLGDEKKTDLIFDSLTKRYVSRPAINPEISRGFIPTPSIPQAITAAILKGGYDAKKSEGTANETLSVNLTSNRVRTAHYYLNGIRNGQELGALLGYRLEREIRDANENAPIDNIILELRNLYPFNAGKVHDINNNVNTEEAEAYNVIDGQALLKDFQAANATGDTNNKLPGKIKSVLNNSEESQLLAILKNLDAALDAINDLLIAESVFQMVAGSPEASSAALKALNEEAQINQMPQFVDIPRSGQSITHRLGVFLDANSSNVAWTTNKASVSSKVSPAINRWLSNQLPNPGNIFINVAIGTPPTTETVTMDKLSLEPVDFIRMVINAQYNMAESELSTRIQLHLIETNATVNLGDKIEIELNNLSGPSSKVSIAELLPLIQSLQKILELSRPVMPDDLICPAELNRTNNTGEVEPNGTLLLSRISNCLNDIASENKPDTISRIVSELQDKLDNLATLVDDQPPSSSDIRSYIDLAHMLLNTSSFGLVTAVPRLDIIFDTLSRQQLVDQAQSAIDSLTKRARQAQPILASVADTDDISTQFSLLKQAYKILLNTAYPLLPDFMVKNHGELNDAHAHSNLLNGHPETAIKDWLLGLSMVRTPIRHYHLVTLFRKLFSVSDRNKFLNPMQLPYDPSQADSWIALKIPNKDLLTLDPLALTFEHASGFNPAAKQVGFIVDEWNESIPEDDIDIGLALHFNRPNHEAPQSMLLLVPAAPSGKWSWNEVSQSIEDTFELAKMRAVEPDMLQNVPLLFRLLPGVVAAMDADGNTPSLDFSRNNFSFFSGIFFPVIDTFISRAVNSNKDR